MDFSQVNDITIPEGSVKKIEVNGTTIWEKDTTVPVTGIEITSTGPFPVTTNKTVPNKVFFTISPNDATDKSVSARVSDPIGYGLGEIGDGFVEVWRNIVSNPTATLYITTNDGGFEDTIELYRA